MVEEHGQDDDMELTQQLRARVVQMESDTVTDTLALRAGNERRALHRRLHRRLYRARTLSWPGSKSPQDKRQAKCVRGKQHHCF